MVAAFTVEKISRNPATFDVKKLTAINGVKIRELDPAEFVKRLLPFLVRRGLLGSPVSDAQLELVTAAAPLVQERSATLVEAAALLDFLLVPDHHLEVDPAAAAKVLVPAAAPVLDAAVSVLEALPSWTAGGRAAGASGARSSTGSRSSRGSRTGRCGSPRPGGRCRRRCSSRWSCSGRSARSPGCGPPVPVWGRLRAWANIVTRRADQVGAPIGVWGNWQPDGFWFR